MKSIMKQINCPYLKSDNGGEDSATMWLCCKLTNKITDPDNCAKCKDIINLLQEDGRLVILPYRKGAQLFYVDENIDPPEIKKMLFLSMFNDFCLGVENMELKNFVFAETVYLSYEEAEKAIKRGKCL